MALAMESQKFSHVDSLCMDSRRLEPLPSLRSFYTSNSNEAPHTGEGAGSSFLWRAANPEGLPPEAVMRIATSRLLNRKVVAAMTGPDSGFQAAREWKDKSASKTLVCGTHVFIDNWKEILHTRAFGKSVSLYDTNPVTGRTSAYITGDPIADAFVVKVRQDSAFLAVADGVNWGEAPMRAARCAINAVYEHLETNLLLGGPQALKIRNTRDAASLLFAAFQRAQQDITAQTRGLSTLCVGLLLPVYLSERHRRHRSGQSSLSTSSSMEEGIEDPESWRYGSALIVASVGDSQAFLLREGTDTVEVTGWVSSRSSPADIKTDCETKSPPERDFRDAGGALGPVYDSGEPELQNLMCAVVSCAPRDVIIFGTDGLTDNFDPVIVRIAIPRSPDIAYVDENDVESKSTTHSKVYPNVHPNWAKMAPISTPYALLVWPKPPPPPPSTLPPVLTSADPDSLLSGPDGVSARSLNYTDQLELTWPERRQYAAKELTRIWYELERIGNGEVSAADFGEALLRHVKRVTAQKRQFLEAPETTKLKAQFSRYMRKKNSMHEKTESGSAVGGGCGCEPIAEKDDELCELERRRAWIMDSMKRMPGKLDHATVVILRVGPD